MLHVTLQLTENQEAMLTERIAAGEFASLEDYVAALVDAETRAKAQERLEALLLDGREGEATEMNDEDWAELHRIATGGE
ncbi:type II toxin-antitoxin system ParD family antitoxin [uncultured Sphingomonas sp.]|uniref:ribbon-helix-helix domain-containing protein n=1 Tax=uncultured Sphingomonas sp. TaxID=158754 RepID=UPI0035CAD9DB